MCSSNSLDHSRPPVAFLTNFHAFSDSSSCLRRLKDDAQLKSTLSITLELVVLAIVEQRTLQVHKTFVHDSKLSCLVRSRIYHIACESEKSVRSSHRSTPYSGVSQPAMWQELQPLSCGDERFEVKARLGSKDRKKIWCPSKGEGLGERFFKPDADICNVNQSAKAVVMCHHVGGSGLVRESEFGAAKCGSARDQRQTAQVFALWSVSLVKNMGQRDSSRMMWNHLAKRCVYIRAICH